MTEGAKVFVVAIVMLVPIVAMIVKSDIGQSIADAIRHNSGANEGAGVRRELESMRGELDQLHNDVGDLQQQVLEAHERLEFTERLLASHAQPDALPRSDA